MLVCMPGFSVFISCALIAHNLSSNCAYVNTRFVACTVFMSTQDMKRKKNLNKKTYKAITLSTANERSDGMWASEYVAFFSLFGNTFSFSFSELFVGPLHFSFVYLPFKCGLKIVLFSRVVHRNFYITWVFAPFLLSLLCARGAFLIIRTMNFASNALFLA